MIGWSLVNSPSKSPSDRPWGCSLVGLQLHQVDDVDDADLELGQVLAQDGHGRQRLQRRHVAGAGHHHVRLAPASLLGPLPDADARGAVLQAAWSIVSHCGAGCLPATITFT